ncbi:MAG: hypothetical protein K6C94_10260 [Candidatus Gastranaerophilales bacterium]|nr:hypothetical protein [Candidatus Gastranaerophilales bacterium]
MFIENQNKNEIFLNSARNCLRYVIRAFRIKQIYLPYYICQAVRYAVKEEDIAVKFYHIDEDFMPEMAFDKNDYILYPNYFGICGRQNKILSNKYKNLISDNAHALFAEKTGCAAFSSPRKFLKVNDGGILISDKIIHDDFQTDADRNIEITDYESFCKNELTIDNESIKLMSEKTKKQLSAVDENAEKQRRLNIFGNYSKLFEKYNRLKINPDTLDVPYVYPFLSDKSALIGKYLDMNDIYTLKYSTNFPKGCFEHELSEHLLLLPLDEKAFNICSYFDFHKF